MHDSQASQSNTLRYMLRPLVRFCLRHSKHIQEFIDTLKVVYVEVALEELSKETKKINVSRLSVVTGVHRHDVVRIFRERRPPIRKSVGLLARVINRWENDSRYCSKAGAPRLLSYEGDENEFKELVAHVSKTLNPGTVLYGLLRAGSVEKTARGLRLISKPLSLSQDPDKLYELLGRNVETLVEAAEHNIQFNPDPRNLHIRTEYNNVYKKDLPKIRQWLLREGRKFHAKARKFLSNCDADINPGLGDSEGTAACRVALGSFSWTAMPTITESEHDTPPEQA
ncbi:MAG: hypothetical protein K1X79_06270 [Oligoflexia bacterium]|nr:hypothetical protein [Oligoflexia bacterium]